MAMLTNDEITAKALDILECEFGPAAHTTRDYQGLFGPQPGMSNKGATYQIRKPPLYEVNEAWAASYQGVDDDYVPLTIDKPRSVDVRITDEEFHLNMTSFEDQVLKPAMSALAHKVNLDVMSLYKKAWNYVGVPEVITSATADFLTAGAIMDENCAPRDGSRAIFLPPAGMAAAVEAQKSLQNDQKKISDQFRRGMIAKDVLGFDWHMTQVVRNHLSGANTGAGLWDGASQTGASLLFDSFTASSAALKEGDIIVTPYYDVNPVTKERTRRRNVVVTSDVTSDATGDETPVPVAPALIAAGKTQNFTGTQSDADDLLLFNHVSSYVNKTFAQGMAWPKQAIAIAFCELKVPKGMDIGATKTDEDLGISVRMTRTWDQDSSSWKVRFQIFYGLAVLRPEWLVRILS